MRAAANSDPRLARRLSWLLFAGLGLAVVLFLAGGILALARPEIPVSASSITGLPAALAALEPGGFLDLGLLVLLATPAARVAALLIAFARRRAWLFSIVCVLVLVILGLGAFLGLQSI